MTGQSGKGVKRGKDVASVDGRDAALRALRQIRGGRCFLDDALEQCLSGSGVSGADVGLATELATGVVRHRLTVEAVLGAVSRASMARLGADLRDVLLVGAYQLVWLDRVPAFAAVDRAVEQAKRIGRRRAGGLVNAVLREVIRRQAAVRCGLDQADPRRCVRVGSGTGCLFDLDVLPSPTDDPVGYMSLATSHPADLVRRWVRRYGQTSAMAMCWAGQSRPPVVLRANALRTTSAALAARLVRDGLEVIVDDRRDAVFLVDAPPVRTLAVMGEGLCQPQDPTAMAVARVAQPKSGQRVLDLCASPGTKTTQMAEMMGDAGLIVASDVSQGKLERIEENCRRLGISIVQPVLADAVEDAARAVGEFDVILVDAPCSNTGVLARRPDARYRFDASRLAKLTGVQDRLLDRAARLASARTRLVYSTCSVEPEENEQSVQRFCQRHRDWRVVDSKQTLPSAGAAGQWQDGGFVAALERAT